MKQHVLTIIEYSATGKNFDAYIQMFVNDAKRQPHRWDHPAQIMVNEALKKSARIETERDTFFSSQYRYQPTSEVFLFLLHPIGFPSHDVKSQDFNTCTIFNQHLPRKISPTCRCLSNIDFMTS